MNLVTQMVRDLESDHPSTEKEKKGELPLFAAANLLYGKNHQPTAKRARLIIIISLLLAMALLMVDRILLPQHYKWKLSSNDELSSLVGDNAAMPDMFETLDLYIDESDIKTSKADLSESRYSNDTTINAKQSDAPNNPDTDLLQTRPLESVAVMHEYKVKGHKVKAAEDEAREVTDNKVGESNQRRVIVNEIIVAQSIGQSTIESKPEPIAEPVILKVKRPLNQESADKRDYENALELLSHKGEIAAINYLSQHQAKSDTEIKQRRFFKSVILYASLLVETQRYSAAESLLKTYQAAHSDKQAFSKLLIRLALKQYNYQQALVLLDKFSLPINQDAEFTELRAVTQQAQSRYVEAADSYQQLLQFDNRRARWWMGLAVAFDGSADFQRAEQAYQQVLLSTDLTTEHNVYALRRINDLSQL